MKMKSSINESIFRIFLVEILNQDVKLGVKSKRMSHFANKSKKI